MNGRSTKTKMGRKGDPRMNNAVTAKLNNNELSLYDALVIGGFDFPPIEPDCKKSTYSLRDSNGVLLGQRKNQLSRRLREAKISQIKHTQNNERQEEGSDALAASAHGAARYTSIQNSSDESSQSVKRMKYQEADNILSSILPPADENLKGSSQRPECAELIIPSVTSDMSWLSKMKDQIDPAIDIEKITRKQAQQLLDSDDKDSDIFSIATISGILPSSSNYASKLSHEVKSSHTYKIKCDVKNSSPIPEGTTSCDFQNACYQHEPNNELKKSAVRDDQTTNVATSNSLNSNNVLNISKFTKAIDIFHSEYQNFLYGTMQKAGFSSNEMTGQNMEMLKRLVHTNAQNGHENLKASSTLSICSGVSVPPKKRKYVNTYQQQQILKLVNCAHKASIISDLTFDNR